MAKDAAKKLNATYDFAIHTHGSIGPSCAVAEFKDGKLTSWSARRRRTTCASSSRRCSRYAARGRALHLRRRRRLLRPQRARGRRRRCGAARARPSASRCACNGCAPTSMAGTRRARRRCIDLRGGDRSRNGNVAAWESEFFMPQTGRTLSGAAAGGELGGLAVATSIAPGNILHDSTIPYTFPNIKSRLRIGCETTPFRPSWIRTPGPHAEHLRQRMLHRRAGGGGRRSIRSTFRLQYLDDAARRANCSTGSPRSRMGEAPLAARRRCGEVVTRPRRRLREIRAGAHLCRRRRRGRGQPLDRRDPVKRILCAHDCGQIINPDGVRNQIEGNIVQTVSRTLKEELTFDRSR